MSNSRETLRSRVEDFFNPGPSAHLAGKGGASSFLENEGADSNDEQVMKSYFVKDGAAADATDNQPKRKIVADIEMDSQIY